jgi:subtilisin family serine protease
MRTNYRVHLAAATLLCLVVEAPAFSQVMSDAVKQQIVDILKAKKAFNAAQKKIDSKLVFGAMNYRGAFAGTSLNFTLPGLVSDVPSTVIVDIKGNGAGVAGVVNSLGGTVISRTTDVVRAAVPLANVEALASSTLVRGVATQELFATNVGALNTQGYVSHKAREVVANLAVNGAGVKVGVLSDSASPARVSALQTSGDLGGGTTVLSASSGSDEGTAMMEIVQDIAPGAQVYFATANGGQAVMAANITALAAAGCSIIVDDITYFAEPAFQDGVIAQAINTFVSNGGLYFSSAGNSGSLLKNTSSVWEGDFLNGGAVTGPIATAGETGFFHNFGTAGSPQNYNTNIQAGGNITLTLKWADPQGGSTNDYDIFVLNSTGTTLKAFSAAIQNGTQDPYEQIAGRNCGTGSAQGFCGSAAGDRIVVVLFSGSPRALRVDANRLALSIGTTGATSGHNAGASTVSVAATYWNSAKTGTKAFTGAANSVENFSSDGPRKVFFQPNGTAITPGNLLFGTNGGQTLQKPDITAADGVSTKTPGFNPFYGTSAAAPHAAGIAALIKSAKPSLTGSQIKNFMFSTALDNMAAGVDINGGVGIVMALEAVQAALQ